MPRVGRMPEGRSVTMPTAKMTELPAVFQPVQATIRRLPENLIPECAVFSFGFKERQQAQTVGLCNCCGDTEAGRKERSDIPLFVPLLDSNEAEGDTSLGAPQ